MIHQTAKIALPALAAAALLAAGLTGQAAAETQTQGPRLLLAQAGKDQQIKPIIRRAQKKPTRPSRGGSGVPQGPDSFDSEPPKRLPDFVLHPGLPGSVTSGMPNTGYCKREGNGGPADTIAFKVQFKTNGAPTPAGGWGASQVTVAFTGAGMVSVPLVSPMWDGTMPVEVEIPNGCYNVGGCQFSITIDPANVVPETSNANNSTTKICAAPAG
ncbi:MAG TPA: hypothetical protein EYH07_12665 [Kiloniellaceae bacterium]|nr:hypothetical protein [Kiloniellaceae bacterium]HIP79302.1 hypothetical protein [Kiloniellaceae bacterium]